MPHFVASDLVLQCLQMSHKKDASLIWVKHVCTQLSSGARDINCGLYLHLFLCVQAVKALTRLGE